MCSAPMGIGEAVFPDFGHCVLCCSSVVCSAPMAIGEAGFPISDTGKSPLREPAR